MAKSIRDRLRAERDAMKDPNWQANPARSYALLQSMGYDQLPNGMWVDRLGNVAPEYSTQRTDAESEAQARKNTIWLRNKNARSRAAWENNQRAAGITPKRLAMAGQNAPSQGPHIGNTFPDYYKLNPNVEQQYIEWRDARIENGEDPYDMEAFRQHLIDLGEEDPGEPQGEPQDDEPFSLGGGDDTEEGGEEAGAPPTLPRPSIVNPGKYVPGAPFTPVRRTGTAQERLGMGLDLSGMDARDVGYYMPFGGNENEDTAASRNLMRALGFNVDLGNPYTSYLQQKLPGIARLAEAQGLLGGTKADTLRRDLPGLTYQGLTGGDYPGLDLVKQIVGLQGKLDEPEGLTKEQRDLATKYLNPDDVLDFSGAMYDLPSGLQRAASRANASMLERYRNLGSSKSDKTLMQFLFGV